MAIGETNATLAKLIRRSGNVPAHVAAVPTARVASQTAPYLQREAARNAGIAARSMGTASAAETARLQQGLKQAELSEYENQNRLSSYLGLADLFGVTPLAMYRGSQLDRQAEQRYQDQMSGMHRLEDRMAANAEQQRTGTQNLYDDMRGYAAFVNSLFNEESLP